MFSQVFGADLSGIQARVIHVEADISDGLPVFSMVGYLSAAVKEAKERVRIVLKNAGIRFPAKRITINLAPAHLRKEGSTFDLPIAISLLAAFGHISSEHLNEYMLIGELSLDGRVLPVDGCLSMACIAKEKGIKKCIVPAQNAVEAGIVTDIDIIGVENIYEVIEYFQGKKRIRPTKTIWSEIISNEKHTDEPDFEDVAGQEGVKRALEIAVSGMHNLLIVGPPGTGKTMLAKRAVSIMPDISFEESMELTKIYSACGMLQKENSLITKRPFRMLHNTVTPTALIGGGYRCRPGEITLASRGILFLDEFFEFPSGVIDLLRQPMEDRSIVVSRLNSNFVYPADFMLIASANPCKCGYYPDEKRCRCTSYEVEKYLARVSRPVMDRIDICAQTILPEQISFHDRGKCDNSETIRKRVEKARKIQAKRYEKETIFFNAQLSSEQMEKYCRMTRQSKKLLSVLYEGKTQSIRGIHRIQKVARTIADLDGAEQIHEEHIAQAMSYRSLELM